MVETDEIRAKFQDYMTSRGYNLTSPDPLVCDSFPTCYTLSGGPNFVGKSNNQSVVIQPCHRYWDVNQVGDNTHLSFFEMAVTYSDNPDDRERILQDQLSFLRSIGLDQFTAHYFDGGMINGVKIDPDNVKSVWEFLGIEQFVPHKDMESYVANKVEPYGGPRTELFYSSKIGKLEVFTSVLYNQKVEGGQIVSEHTPPTIAAGFGLERVIQAANGLTNISDVHQIEASNPIVKDHIRGLVFLARDGAFDLTGSKNSSRKTLLNRYLRNFIQNLREFDDDFVRSLVSQTIEIYQNHYSNLVGREEEFTQTIKQRVQRLNLL